LTDWDQIKLLSIQINRLRQWHRPGLLCIGDAAHAMSPAGGVGINLAIQDAVAAANLLAAPLCEGRVSEATLAQVQRRRAFPTMVTQQMQVFAHSLFERVFQNPGPARAPWQLKTVFQLPGLQLIIARTIGMGVRPEHIRGATKGPRRSRILVGSIAVGIGVAAAVFAASLLRRRRQSLHAA
jgi:2-polyprenyl-6-methoxyphenol hydroxylase-like FAD-dependent oxidoreductase